MTARSRYSNDYDVRKALVRQLLQEGMERSHIRHELTLGTSSSGGRADVVLIHDGKLKGIEIKSGKDVLDNLEQQDFNNSLAFDETARIIDKRHFGDKQPCISSVYCHDTKRFVSYFRGDYLPIEESQWRDSRQLLTSVFRESYRTSIGFMANLLWRDEIVAICGRRTRWECLQWVREYGTLNTFRKSVIQKLLERPLSKWEQAFWNRFDAEAA